MKTRHEKSNQKSLIWSIILFFAITSFSLALRGHALKGHNKEIAISHNTVETGTNLYVPSIAVVMSGTVNGDCTTIDYTIFVRNTSTNSESLTITEAIDTNDAALVVNLTPVSGDSNTNGILDPGESWELNASRNLSPDDLGQDTFQNQVRITCEVVGQPSVTAVDLSDDNLFNEDDPTILDISSCRNIGAVLLVETKDFLGNSPGCITIEYTLVVRNLNTANESYTNIAVTDQDPDLTFTGATPNVGDSNNDGIFDAGESWEFTASRNLTTNDYDMGALSNQATITGELLGQPSLTVSDLSHPSDFNSDAQTDTDILCSNDIRLIKTGVFGDQAEGGECTTVSYTFQLIHAGGPTDTFESVVLVDPLLGGNLGEPNSGDEGASGVLEPGETWIFDRKYIVTPSDFIVGQITNQAYVEAVPIPLPNNQFRAVDLSDFENFEENRPTVTDVAPCPPSITVIKKGVDVIVCEELEYSFSVVNQSLNGEVLENVVLTDPLLGGVINGPASGDTNNNGLLEVGEEWAYIGNYTITQQDIANGQVTNQATVTADVQGQPSVSISDLSDDDNVWEDDPTVFSLSHCIPNISLIKTGTALDEVGGSGCFEIFYTFQVTNEGALTVLENPVLTDPLFGGVITGPTSGDDNNNDQIDQGETWIYNATYTILQQDLDDGQVTNQASVTADVVGQPGETVSDLSDDDSPTEDDPTVISLINCVPRINLIKTGVAKNGQGEVDGCAFIDYTFRVTNESTDGQVLENVAITDLNLPISIPLIPNEGDDVNPGQLDPGETWIFNSVEYQLTTEDRLNGQVENSAVVTATMVGSPDVTVQDISDYESADEDRPTIILLNDCEPRIGLIKAGVVNADCTAIDYTFTVTNESTSNELLENVVLTDLNLPMVISGPTGDENNIGLLDPDETWIYTATQPITQDDIDFGCFHNQAHVTSNVQAYPDFPIEDLSDDNSPDEDDITQVDLSSCQNLSIGLVKEGVTVDIIDNDGCDDHIQYTFTVHNTGDVALTTVSIVDDLLQGNPILDETSDDGSDGILSVGENWIFSGLYPLQQSDIDSGNVENTATVTAFNLCGTAEVQDQSDDDSPNTNENDPTNTAISPDACEQGTASISLIKTGALEDLNQDDCQESILYTFTVTNNGDVALDTVILLDNNLFGGEVVGPITGTDVNEDGVLSPAESWTFEAIYAIVQEDIDQTFVENTATVTAEIFDTDIPVQDISHPSDEDLDGPTQTDVPSAVCTTGAPSIDLNKIGNLHDFNNDGCIESILYSFTVTNIGDFDLLEVVLQDDFLGGTVDGPDPNTDAGNDNVLSIGESWSYQVQYSLVPNDINSTINNQAVVSAKPENLDVTISDGDSDSTMVPSDVCTTGGPGIALVKTGELDDLDLDGCNESIRYTFTVSNVGSVNLSEITLEDQKLSDEISTQPSLGEDIGDDGILSVDESWTFTANYSITEIDIENGSVVNQATVFASITGQQTKVSDLSDDNSPLENNPTETLVPDEICGFTNIDPDFEIFNGITPNGDGINDYFQINGIEAYPDNTLKIFNRWGALVYEAEGYGIGNKLFTGVSEGKATVSKENKLPGGTYFYILEFPNENPGEKSYSGYLFISNNN